MVDLNKVMVYEWYEENERWRDLNEGVIAADENIEQILIDGKDDTVYDAAVKRREKWVKQKREREEVIRRDHGFHGDVNGLPDYKGGPIPPAFQPPQPPQPAQPAQPAQPQNTALQLAPLNPGGVKGKLKEVSGLPKLNTTRNLKATDLARFERSFKEQMKNEVPMSEEHRRYLLKQVSGPVLRSLQKAPTTDTLEDLFMLIKLRVMGANYEDIVLEEFGGLSQNQGEKIYDLGPDGRTCSVQWA
jgi:hypothetical protein